MRKVTFLVTVLILLAFTTAFARKKPLPKPAPGGAAIGIEVNLRTPSGMSTGTPDIVFFVKTDAEHGVKQDTLIPADYVSGSRAYLLNVVPGEYAAVACANRGVVGKVPILGVLTDAVQLSGGQNPMVMTYFSSELVESTRVSVAAGEFGFAGTFRVRQAEVINPDPVAMNYLIKSDNARLGNAEETKRDDEARRLFLSQAKADLAEGGWGALVLAAANPAEKRPAASQSPVALARDLLDRSELGPVDEGEFLMKSKAVREWLATHPDDVDALIVAARVHWLEEMSNPVGITPGEKQPDPAARYEPAHKLLDHALALQPQSAEAYYWKARLFGVTAPYLNENSFEIRPLDAGRSVAFARKAVDLAPAEVRYSVALAQYLDRDLAPKEAMKVLEALPDGRHHPLYALLGDFDAFQLPEQAVFNRAMSQTMTQAQTARGTLRDYRPNRVRCYVIPAAAKEFEPFFIQHWPGFKQLGKPQREDDTPIDMYQFAFKYVDGAWVAQKSPPKSDRDLDGIMAIIVSELRNPDSEARKRLPPSAGNVYTVVAMVDYRVTER